MIPTTYPSELKREVVLHDGTTVRLRPILPRDAGSLTALYDRLSLTTAYQRFFAVMKRLPPGLGGNAGHRRLP